MTTDPAADAGRTRNAFAAAVWGQSFGVQPQQALGRGLGLLYLHALGIPAGQILVLLSLPLLVRGLLSIPMGFWADRVGKKRVGMAGQILAIAGFGVLALAAWTPRGWPVLAPVTVGLVAFGAGTALFGAGWFALLSPLIPREARGRYLGRLRFTRQLAAVAFGSALALFLGETTSLAGFQGLFALLTGCLVVRLVFYHRIPELEPSITPRVGLAEALGTVFAIPGYRRFAAFVLLIFTTVGAIPMLFGLLELEVLQMGDGLIWQLGVAMIAGHLLGSLVAGRLVDALGGRFTLALCQGTFLASLTLLITRDSGPSLVLAAFAASILFGIAKTGLQIAITTELLGLAPGTHKALAVSTCTTLIYLGESLAGLLIAWALQSQALAAETLANSPLIAEGMSRYDVVLIGLAVALAILWVLTPLAVPRRSQRSA